MENNKILFFVWTDIQLINCLNTKLNYYEKADADLLIYNQGRVSEQLLQIVRERKVFLNIYTISPMTRCEKENRVALFFWHIKARKFISEQLEKTVDKKVYKKFCVAAFWSETLNVFEYIKKSNPDIEVEIIEEGMANYDGPKDWVYRTAPTSKIKSAVRGLIHCRSLGIRARKSVECCYLYRPELSWTHKNETVRKLPVIQEDGNVLLYKILKEWEKKQEDSYYKELKNICIADAPTYLKNSFELFADLLKGVSRKVRYSSVIKLHPLYVPERENVIEQNKDGIWVDSRKFPIEKILLLSNIEDKVLIVDRSSVLLYLKCMLGKEPYVILTYHLSQFLKEDHTDNFDYFIDKLRGIYAKPEKIMIPNTYEEFKYLLESIGG